MTSHAELADALKDRYRLLRELGHGGMATVYLAEDLKHEREVALKVMRAELAHSLGVERFEREIKLAARLQHPHVLSVFDSGEDAGRLWFTMPYIRGESLRERLQRDGRLDMDEAVRIAREAAQGLHYAHRQGVVHRDIKPENILLAEDGATLVADFGIARALDESGRVTMNANLTQTGTSLGTPVYMAPEQATGQGNLDARVDQYALAVTLHEMLAGEPPFTGANAAALVAARFTSPVPSIRVHRPEAPPSVEQALQKALSLQPGDRFATIADFARELAPGVPTPLSSPAVPAATVALPATRPPRRVPSLAVALGLGLLLGAGVLFAWRRGRTGEAAIPAAVAADSSVRTIAVLPFENLGDSADAYFADGITDELRGKLTSVPDLEVIARGSSNQYRHSTKPQQDIARELNVRYLLTGTVRWEKSDRGKGRVRVSPELIEVGASGRPTSKWQQPFDAPLTDVFQVQGDIAGKVASALNVALGSSAQAALARAPTANLAAYDAYLKGEAAWQAGATSDPRSIRRAIASYEQATTLDPAFVLAWHHLTVARGFLYSNSTPTPELAAATRAAAERTEQLAPGSKDGAIARARYASQVLGDATKAHAILAPVFEATPYDPDVVRFMASAESQLGQWDAALQHYESASRLDPRSSIAAQRLAWTLLYQHRYPEAQAAIDRAIELSPSAVDNHQLRVEVRLAQGDFPGARQQLATALTLADTAAVVAYFANYDDLYWVLDDAQQRLLLTLPPSAFDDDRAVWALVRMQVLAFRGETALARAYADSAEQVLAEQVRRAPDDGQRHALRGLALAYAGRSAEAVAEGERAVALTPVSRNGIIGPYLQHQLVRIHILTGHPEQALDELESLLEVRYLLSPGWLRVDPNFAPLRGHPRFERLVAGA